jgi:hypothetical protein
MIASEFRSRVRPLKTVTRAAGHAIGDSVLYHSLLGLASGERFAPTCRIAIPGEPGPIYLWEGLLAPVFLSLRAFDDQMLAKSCRTYHYKPLNAFGLLSNTGKTWQRNLLLLARNPVVLRIPFGGAINIGTPQVTIADYRHRRDI